MSQSEWFVLQTLKAVCVAALLGWSVLLAYCALTIAPVLGVAVAIVLVLALGFWLGAEVARADGWDDMA